MKNRGTYVLLGLFFAGLVALWAADYANIPDRAARDRSRNRVLADLVDTKPDAVRKIEIEGGPEPIVFERREGNAWQMTSPLGVAADPSKVESLAYNLKELTRKPEADTLTGDLASFGLAPPSRVVKLWGGATDSPLATLEVGKVSLDRRYVRAGGAKGVEVVEARMVELVELEARKWRDREIFRVPSFEVDAVAISTPGVDLKLRKGADAWRIVAPSKLLASESKVEGLIADLGSLRIRDDSRYVADGISPADLGRYGLDKPRLIVEVEAGRGGRRRPPQSLHVGNPVEGKPGQVYVRKGDQDDVMAVDSRALDALGTGVNDYRSPKVVDIQPARVARFRVESGGEAFELVRSSDLWYIVRPTPARTDRKSVEEFLKAVAEYQTSIYLAPDRVPDAGVDADALVLTFWDDLDGREPSASVRFGRRDAGKRTLYARVEGDPTILALPETVENSLPRSALSFRDRSILSVPTDQIVSLAFEGQGKKVVLRPPVLKLDPRKRSSEGWWMVEPVASPTDADSVARLMELLADLKADAFASDRPKNLSEYGLEDPALKLTWTLGSAASPTPALGTIDPAGTTGHEEQSLLVGSAVQGRPGSRFAMITRRPLVFVLGAASLAKLDAEWHRHRVLGFDPGLARKVRLTWPGREFTVSAVEDSADREWKVGGPIDAPGFDPAATGALVNTLSALATARFSQYVGEFPERAGLAVPRLSILIDLGSEATPKLLRVGNFAGNGLTYATTDPGTRGALFTVPEALLARWIKEPGRRGDLPDQVFAPDQP